MLKRGFKSQCERRAIEIRRQLGLQPIDPLSALELAERQQVAVWYADRISNVSQADLDHLLGEGRAEWSGFTLRVEDHNLVVVNSTQSQRRQNSVVMHELAHIMLGHELTSTTFTHDGHLMPSTYDQDQEDEAAWLGATLLLPRPALLWMRRRRMSDDVASRHFAVSPDLLTWRIRMTGIDYQLGLRAPS